MLAVDVPSGLDCDTGQPLGPCVRAVRTVTFVAEKVGFGREGVMRAHTLHRDGRRRDAVLFSLLPGELV